MKIEKTAAFKIKGEEATVWVRQSDDDDTVELKDDSGDVVEFSPAMALAIAGALTDVATQIQKSKPAAPKAAPKKP